MKNTKKASKVVVRNTKLHIPKTNPAKTSNECLSTNKSKDLRLKNLSKARSVKLDVPVSNSTLKVVKQIKDIENLKTLPENTLDAGLRRITLQEKITKHLNFPLEKHIYKDLISLNPVPTVIQNKVARDPLPQKDKEPVLSDFLKPRKTRQYIHMDKVELPDFEPIRKYDCFKLDRLAINHFLYHD